jgi:hypothetical protein
LTRSATTILPRTNTSSRPPPALETDWAQEYKNYRQQAVGLAAVHAGNFNPTPFGVISTKLEKRHTDSIFVLVVTVYHLLGEITTI